MAHPDFHKQPRKHRSAKRDKRGEFTVFDPVTRKERTFRSKAAFLEYVKGDAAKADPRKTVVRVSLYRGETLPRDDCEAGTTPQEPARPTAAIVAPILPKRGESPHSVTHDRKGRVERRGKKGAMHFVAERRCKRFADK